MEQRQNSIEFRMYQCNNVIQAYHVTFNSALHTCKIYKFVFEELIQGS